MPAKKTPSTPTTNAKVVPAGPPTARTARAPRPAGQAGAAAATPPQQPPPQPPAASGKPAESNKKGRPRPKLVRDSFTMPESDIALIGVLKAKALTRQRAAKKSELLRAGLHVLAALDAAGLIGALDRLEPIKTGRPKKGP